MGLNWTGWVDIQLNTFFFITVGKEKGKEQINGTKEQKPKTRYI